MNGHDLETFFLLPLLADRVQIASRSCRMRTVFAESARNSPVINTKFGNNSHVRVPTITEHDTTETRQSRLQCGTADCDRFVFRQCPEHPEYGDSCRIPDAWISTVGSAAHVWSIEDSCVCHSVTERWPVHHENWRIGTNSTGTGFLNNIWLLSWLNKCFYKFELPATNHRILIRLLTNFNREWSYEGRQ